MVTYVAKVGAWEAAVAAVAAKESSTTPSCSSPLMGADGGRRRSLIEEELRSPLGRSVDGVDGGDEPWERMCSVETRSDGSCAHCAGVAAGESPARRPSRLEDASTQTEDEELVLGEDSGGTGDAKLRFRKLRGVLHKTMSKLVVERDDTLPNPPPCPFAQSACSVLRSGASPHPKGCSCHPLTKRESFAAAVAAAQVSRLISELGEARRQAAETAESIEKFLQDEMERTAAAAELLAAAERERSVAEERLAEALLRGKAVEEIAALRAREVEERAATLVLRVAELEQRAEAEKAKDARLLIESRSRAIEAGAVADAVEAATARAQAAERRNEELVARIELMEREAVERQLDDNYVQAVAAERAKALEKDKADLEGRLADALRQAATAEASTGRIRELERRLVELHSRAEAAERAQSQVSTAVVSPQQEASGAFPGLDEALRDARQRIRIFEVERTSTALLLEDLSRRYDETAAALASSCSELARTQALLRCEQRLAEQLRFEYQTNASTAVLFVVVPCSSPRTFETCC